MQDVRTKMSSCSICKVSGEQIRVSLHYGAYSCQACSLFFRRQASKAKKDACISMFGNCLETEEEGRKSSCKACRFQACIDQGMKPELVDCKKKWNIEGKQGRRGKKRSVCEDVGEADIDGDVEAKAEDTDGKLPEVLGFFITIPGKQPRFVDLNPDSGTSSLSLFSFPPFRSPTDLASDIGKHLNLSVPVREDDSFSELVAKDVTPAQAKSVITYGVRTLQRKRTRFCEPLNLSERTKPPEHPALSEHQDTLPEHQRLSEQRRLQEHPALSEQQKFPELRALSEQRKLPPEHQELSEFELNVPERSEPIPHTKHSETEGRDRLRQENSMNIQEFVAQYDFNNDKFDKIVFDLQGGEGQFQEPSHQTNVSFYVENEKSSSSNLPNPRSPSGVIKYQSRRLRNHVRNAISNSISSEVQFSDF